MSKVSKMSMAEIFNKVDIKFDLADIAKICPNKEARNKICELILAGKNHFEVMIDNEVYIDKEKLLLVTWLNYKKEIEEKKKELSSSSILNTPLSKARLEQDIRNLNNRLSKIRKLSRDIDVYIVTVHHKDKLATDITVISSREEILGFDFSEREKYNRGIFDYIDQNLLTEQDDLGMKYALQTIEYEDFEKGMPYDVAQAVTHRIRTNNIILGENYINWFTEKQEKGEEDDEEVERLSDEYRQNVALPEMRSAIKEVLRYVDFKKLLLIEIYRLEQNLDESFSSSNRISNQRLQAAQTVASFLLGIIGKDAIIEDEDVTYTYEDAQNFLNRIDIEKDLYITTNEAKELKEELLQGLNLETVNQEEKEKFCRLSYTSEELEKIMNISKENFNFGMTMQDLSEDQIIQKAHQYKDKWSDELTEYFHSEGKLSITSILGLYYDGIIDAEFFKEFSEENDISSEINLNEIKILCSQIKQQKEPNEEENKKLDAMIKLYKLINLDEKNEEEKAKVYSEVIEKIESEEDVLFYYERGLLTLQIVADLSGELAIEKLYAESKITFEDIEELDMEPKSKQAVLGKIIVSKVEEYDTETLLKYINKGYLSESDIFRIYEFGVLNEVYAEDMLNKGIISVPIYIKITDITKEKLEEEANVVIPGTEDIGSREFFLNIDEDMEQSDISIDEIPTSKPKRIRNKEHKGRDNQYQYKKEYKESLIDPDIRWKFLKALKCRYPKNRDTLNNNPESPFYNYEFFVIENKDNNKVEKDSIIIGERFYKDKTMQTEFATKNATYVWQYKDYLIAKKQIDIEQKRNKKTLIKETRGVIYLAEHRPGGWATNLLYAIGQAIAGESFKNDKEGDERSTKLIEQLEKIYTHEELNKILELAIIIDKHQAITNAEGKKVPIVYEVTYDKRVASHNGHDEGDGR